jgi:hypothetical protein
MNNSVESMAPSFAGYFPLVDSNECARLVTDTKEQPYIYN